MNRPLKRKRYEWKCREHSFALGDRTLLMGVLNVTPDSFSDGGKYLDPERALAHALAMEADGADLIDVGAESTRPGSQRISEEEEWRRLEPVLKKLRSKLTIPFSVDTYKGPIAEKALLAGASIVNDPSSLTLDPTVAKAAAQYNAGLVLNHMRGTPETWAKLPPLPDPIGSIYRDLDASVNRARRTGVDKSRIVADPGIGFGKRKEQNAEIIAKLPVLGQLDVPILVGVSRKSFLARTSEEETSYATAAAVAACILAGAHLVRVHDIRQMAVAAQTADAIAAAVE